MKAKSSQQYQRNKPNVNSTAYVLKSLVFSTRHYLKKARYRSRCSIVLLCSQRFFALCRPQHTDRLSFVKSPCAAGESGDDDVSWPVTRWGYTSWRSGNGVSKKRIRKWYGRAFWPTAEIILLLHKAALVLWLVNTDFISSIVPEIVITIYGNVKIYIYKTYKAANNNISQHSSYYTSSVLRFSSIV